MPNSPAHGIFHKLLGNTFVASMTNAFAWFCVTFWVFLETKSILATSLIAGIFAITNALTSLFFGAIVDHHHKKLVMLGSSIASLTAYSVATLLYFTQLHQTTLQITSLSLWLFIIALMLGTIAGNLRGIALATCVSIFFMEGERDKANGLVGTVNGISFACTSLFSGLVIGLLGMYAALIIVLGLTFLAIVHILTISVPEKEIVSSGSSVREKIDFSGTLRAIREIPGMFALIFFTTFNNFLGGIFMALMDSYGLSLVSVQTWGILFSVLSGAFILGGIIVAKKGLGKSPLKTLFTLNILTWTSCVFFTIQPSVVLLVIGIFIWMICGPAIEASEHTIIQNVISIERQGRVFGFAQSIETAAMPVTAFLIGPLTHFVFVPFMTTGNGARYIGSWFGTGQDRAIALVFVLSGLIGLIVTLIARQSKATRLLSERYAETQAKTA